MIHLSKDDCCGCGACFQICPKHCITMEEDYEGFLYPKINTSICIKCDRCDDVCPYQHHKKRSDGLQPLAYGVVCKDEKRMKYSSSGGAFPVLAEYIVKNGGIVYGAAFSEDFFSVCHIRITDKNDLHLIYGSKYVQSDTGNTYDQAKNDLEQGKMVLFSGTPCQIAGLKSFLKRDYEKLICVEIICHGVPSPLIWRRYLSYISNKISATVRKVIFREKSMRGGGTENVYRRK